MAEQQSSQERTEQPTEKRKKDSKKKGQVPRSRELNTMISLLFGAFGLIVLGQSMYLEFSSLLESALSFDRQLAFRNELIVEQLIKLIVSSVVILLPFFAVVMVGAMIGPIAMGGWTFSLSAMAFKLEKISPAKGIKRVFSAKGLLELLKALFKFITIAIVAVFLFNIFLEEILALSDLDPIAAFGGTVSILQWALVALSLAMIFIVVFDVPFEIWNHNRQLKMTRREVQDEMKESEGRPEVKSRIRTLQREMSQRRTMEATATADVVITNPTHFAVAIKYESVEGGAPVVLAKGCDLIALKIRSVAIENNVAIFEAPPLARALYGTTEVGEEIPENLYLAVAKVLAYIYQLTNASSAEAAVPPEDIPVPEEYRDLYNNGEPSSHE